MRIWKNALLGIMAVLLSSGMLPEQTQDEQPPNIIIILADDMGYSDLGCMGSEIATPNLDKLAGDGMLFTNFYNTSRCCPSRASLLTGLYQHNAGIGGMSEDLGTPSYQGYLNNRCVTIAEVLKGGGYHTIMSGKWHVGDKREHWPDKRGFDDFYGIPAGGGLYFYPSKFINRPIYRNGEEVKPDSAKFYSTDAFTDEAIRFINSRSDKEPFFLYLAYIAPHFPLQALPEDIAKYEGKYSVGYEVIRQQRFKKQKALGILPENILLTNPDYKSWDTIQDKSYEARKMEVYAAQVDRLDQNVGNLIQYLEETGELDNTLIMFLSDNGATSEEQNRSPDAKLGTAASFASYGQSWANVSNTPYRLYKKYVHEGGIRTPLIVHWPKGIRQKNKLISTVAHINDIMPTCLEVAGVPYPDTYQQREVLPLDGSSFAHVLIQEDTQKNNEKLFWEHFGNKAVRDKDWKLVRSGNEPWELYNLAQDPGEMNNQSLAYPEKVSTLEAQWNEWADSVDVMDIP